MFYRKYYSSLMILWLVVLGVAGRAKASHGTGAVYFSPVLAHWMTYQAANQIKDDYIWGARLGVDILPTLAVEAFGLRGLSEIDDVTDRLAAGITSINAKYDAFGVGFRLNWPGFVKYVPYLSVSGGQAKVKFDGPITSLNYSKVSVNKIEKRNLLIVGAGTEIFLTRSVALRFDLQDHFINRDFIGGDPLGVRKTHNWEFGAGLTLLLGGKNTDHEKKPAVTNMDVSSRPFPVEEEPVIEKPMISPVQQVDSDTVGVPGPKVICPDTSAVVPVDENGQSRYAEDDSQISILFDLARANVKQEFYSELNRVAVLVKQYGVRIRIDAFADVSGPSEYNLRLSDRRGRAVCDFLITAGVPPSALSYTAHGKYPVDRDGKPDRKYQRIARLSLIK